MASIDTVFLFFVIFCCPTLEAFRVRATDEMKDEKHGIKMGQLFPGCDDAETDLDVDWDGSPLNYTCFAPKEIIPVDESTKPIETCTNLSKDYYPQHHCMDEKIEYNVSIPTYGDHRPLWPIFGEYVYVPPQRWLHNIEHGSVVMLYHPCANPQVVQKLRQIVKSCIRKHVITPYTNVSIKRPLVLVTWGCKLEMSTVNKDTVTSFIKRTALKGPEGKYSKQGQYDILLLKKAIAPPGSDENDSVLCPKMDDTANLNALSV